MEAVAAGDVIAVDAQGLTGNLAGDMGALALELMGLDIAGLVEGRGAAGLAGGHQVAGDRRSGHRQ